ncbi:MAG: signal peptidase II [Cellulosilyticaceae bacterium]
MKFVAAIVVALLVGLDQLTKYWAEVYLQGQPDIKLWPDVFHLSYVENRGAAFGMMQGRQTFFVIITLVVLVGIIYYWRHIPKGKIGGWMKVALILVISGAIGNAIDRVLLNYVRDMFYFTLIDFPVFNVADICVVVGVIALVPLLLLSENQEQKQKDSQVEQQ